jgi:hypothetical protein
LLGSALRDLLERSARLPEPGGAEFRADVDGEE